MPRKAKSFTLVEIVVCMAILSLIAGFSGWGIQGMVSEYRYQKSRSLLLSDLKKCHLIALANQTDLELHIWKEGEKVLYQFRTDDPIAYFSSKPVHLSGITKVLEGKKEIHPLHLPIYSTGRVGNNPLHISFFKKNGEGFILHLATPHIYKIEPRSPHETNQS